MIRFYGHQPPTSLSLIRVGGICPHCKQGGRYTLTTQLLANFAYQNKLAEFVLSYACDLCQRAVPIKWTIGSWPDASNPVVGNPVEVHPSREEFDFTHVPSTVRKEIEEALDCLSVGAYHGFAAMCRRTVQAIAATLGAGNSSKVEAQMNDALKTAGLDEDPEWQELAKAVVLTGHDGSHPNLPEVDRERALVLLSLIGDLTDVFYTRPGRIKQAVAGREAAIAKGKEV